VASGTPEGPDKTVRLRENCPRFPGVGFYFQPTDIAQILNFGLSRRSTSGGRL
jgi:hypothetical protein